MSRIAFCVSGEIRTWENSDIDGESPKQTVLTAIRKLRHAGHTVDLYGSTWDYCNRVDDSEFNQLIYNDSDSVRKWVDNTLSPNFRRMGLKPFVPTGGFNVWGQIWNILNAFKISGSKYDVYIRTRFDAKLDSEWNHIIDHMIEYKHQSMPVVNLPGLVVVLLDGKIQHIEQNTDIVSLVDNDYWKLLFDTGDTIEQIMENMYVTVDDFAKCYFKIYEKTEDVVYISTVSKQKILRDPEYDWFYNLDDVDKFYQDNRPT